MLQLSLIHIYVSIGTPPGNLYGVAPDNPSKTAMVSHKITDGELDRWIYDYYMARPVNYVIVDGLQGFQLSLIHI